MPVQTISHYRLIEKIGTGGMGAVYRAEDTRLGRSVALKFLPPELSTDQQALERFRREARAASALNHPNICTIYDIAEQGGQPFLIMELLEGQTLKSLIRGRPLPLDQVLHLGLQIADALNTAHSYGVIHRDIKPENILVTERGQAKILDFGLAKFAVGRPVAEFADASALPMAAAQAEYVTSPGTIVGTTAYMSPEQVRGELEDKSADIYSFGTLLYEMATGRHPFLEDIEAGNTAKVLDAILHKTPIPPRSLNPEVPLRLQSTILRCLEKRPEGRFQSMKEIASVLSAVKRAGQRWSLLPSVPSHGLGAMAARIVIAPFGVFLPRISAMESGEKFAWLTLVLMGAMIIVGLIPLSGTILGFGMAFGASLLAYESYLLLKASKSAKQEKEGPIKDVTARDLEELERLRQELVELEREYIQKALDLAGWDKSRAAKLLHKSGYKAIIEAIRKRALVRKSDE